MLRPKKDNSVTIIIPVFEEPELVTKFVNSNKEILEKHPLFVINRKGGDVLRDRASFYKKTSCPTIGMLLGSSRKFLIRRVQTKFTLCLDTDVLLPENFVQEALKKFEDSQVAAVALDYEKSQDHLAFGPSIWRTKILQKMYNWEYVKTTKCECIYMWDKLHKNGYKIETVDMRAKHIKDLGDFMIKKKGGLRNYTWKNIMRILGFLKFKVVKYII